MIVDLRLKDAEWWQRVCEGQLMSLPGSSHYDAVPPKLSEDLLLETLLFASQAAREDTGVAKSMFGMASSVSSPIASLTLPQVRTIAMGNSQQLRVR